ncbi:Lipase (class 3) [Geosmithia morbida]|uniref:Lipase (Class 3) n=1 Tax=Geosmithia morbida TaxID=1094350 RepID=A0A9P4YWY7_9HYPO|nr:Lipase (class 3) [Geosmithia morbida]KAF4124380.1 Lipase (class 3) [Geosmithia morbida]
MVSAWSLLALASLALASPVKTIDDYARSLVSRDDVVTQSTLDRLEYYVQYAAAAYCTVDVPVNSTIKCGGQCDELEGRDIRVLGTFFGDLTEISAFVAIDDANKEIVFSVRGSKTVANWIADLSFILVDTDLVDDGKVHQGFATAWNELERDVASTLKSALASNPTYTVVSTGHSLGAAVATIGGAVLRAKYGIPLDLYVYGSPRVGNAVLADFITNQDGAEYRVTHTDDPVPRLPPIFFGYRHISPEYWLTSPAEDGDDYPLSDVVVCTGNANIDCNGGEIGVDTNAHLYYFGPISTTLCFSVNVTLDDLSVSLYTVTTADGENAGVQIAQYAAKDKEFVELES